MKKSSRRRPAQAFVTGPCCPLYNAVCRHHNFIHGAEAEELREGLENIIKGSYPYEEVHVVDIQALLDQVDARDSIAYREARDREEKTGVLDLAEVLQRLAEKWCEDDGLSQGDEGYDVQSQRQGCGLMLRDILSAYTGGEVKVYVHALMKGEK